MNILRLGVFTIMVAGFMGCSSPNSIQTPTHLTTAQVKRSLTVGVTTQEEVVKALGTPNMLLKSSSRGETWTYDQVRVDSTSIGFNLLGGIGGISTTNKGGETGSILGGGGAQITDMNESSSVRTMTVLIKFDENGVVCDYQMMYTAF